RRLVSRSAGQRGDRAVDGRHRRRPAGAAIPRPRDASGTGRHVGRRGHGQASGGRLAPRLPRRVSAGRRLDYRGTAGPYGRDRQDQSAHPAALGRCRSGQPGGRGTASAQPAAGCAAARGSRRRSRLRAGPRGRDRAAGAGASAAVKCRRGWFRETALYLIWRATNRPITVEDSMAISKTTPGDSAAPRKAVPVSDAVLEAMLESFPASDPPSWTGTRLGAPPGRERSEERRVGKEGRAPGGPE